MKRTRLMVICCLTLVVMLFTTAQALAYTYTVKNETSKPVYASFYYMTDSNDHHFNGGNAIAPGQSSTLHMKGVRCMARLNIKYEGKWHYYDSPGCGNKSFTLTEGLKIHKD